MERSYASTTILPRSTAMDGERGNGGPRGPGGRHIEYCPLIRRFLRGDGSFSVLISYHSRRGDGRLSGSPGTLDCSGKRLLCMRSSSSGMRFGTRGAYKDKAGQRVAKNAAVCGTYRGDFPLDPVPVNRLHPFVASNFAIDHGAVFALRDFCCTEAMREVIVQHAEEKSFQAWVSFHTRRPHEW